jgi:hypothetical protein
MIVNYDRKTFIVQATGFNNSQDIITLITFCEVRSKLPLLTNLFTRQQGRNKLLNTFSLKTLACKGKWSIDT